MIKKIVISVLAAAALTTNAYATEPAPAFTFDSLTASASGPYWNLGFQFVANQAIDVVALGSLTSGIGESPVKVGLWNSFGNLLASAEVTLGSTTVNQFSYENVDSVRLTAGSNYFVASVGYTTYGWAPTNAATSPLITYVRDAWALNGTSLAFPDKSDGRTNINYGGIFGGNVLVAAVPEPETYAMLLAGLGLIGAAVKRRKAKPASSIA